MNSKYVIGFGTLVAILIGVVAYIGITQNNTPTDETDDNSTTPITTITPSDNNTTNEDTIPDNNIDNQPQEETINSNFQDFAQLTEDYQCTFSSFQRGTSNNGTIYKSGSRIRAQYTSNDSALNNAEVNMIRGSEKTYIWFDDTGYVYNNSVIDNNTITAQDTIIDPLDTNNSIDFECILASPSGSLYQLPAGIDFQEITSTLDQINNEISQTQLDTSVCDDVEAGESRDQCIQSLQAAQ